MQSREEPRRWKTNAVREVGDQGKARGLETALDWRTTMEPTVLKSEVELETQKTKAELEGWRIPVESKEWTDQAQPQARKSVEKPGR